MRTETLICIILLSFSINLTFSQKPDETNTTLDFQTFLKGVNSVVVTFNDKTQAEVDNGKYYTLTKLIEKYLRDIGFEYIAISTADKKSLFANSASICEICSFSIIANGEKGYKVSFSGCDARAIYSNPVIVL